MAEKRGAGPIIRAWLDNQGPVSTLLAATAALCAAVAAIMQSHSYRPAVAYLWLASLALSIAWAYRQPRMDKASIAEGELALRDLPVLFALIAAFAPLYLLQLYWVPFQMNTDEIVIAQISERFAGHLAQDLLGPSTHYFGIPTGIFALMGKIAAIAGRADLFTMRAIHATAGLLIIPSAYAFFRLGLRRDLSVVATTVLMSNHALLLISRTVSRNNLAVLNVVLAFYFLLRGCRRQSFGDIFLGGILCGLSYYHYPPARLIFPLWLVGLALFSWNQRRQAGTDLWLVRPLRAGLTSAAAFLITILPMTVATFRSPTSEYSRAQILLYDQGRQHQREFYNLDSTAEGLKLNLLNAITMFNTKKPDQAGMYWNVKAGFLDPFSGALLWVGLITLLTRSSMTVDIRLFTVASFFALWLLYGLVMNKAPNYTRLFLILPFIAATVAVGIERTWLFMKLIAKRWSYVETFGARLAALIVFTATILYLNLSIAADFTTTGLVYGNDVGSTARYVEARRHHPNYSFYVVTNPGATYYEHEYTKADTASRIRFSAGNQQRVFVIPPDETSTIASPPLTILTRRHHWPVVEAQLRPRHRNFTIHNLLSDGSLMAVEVW